MTLPESPELVAFDLHVGVKASLEPAPPTRQWMTSTPRGYAYRCLPMVVANQHGWLLCGAEKVKVEWNGDVTPAGVRIDYPDGTPVHAPAVSHFGCGIVTFHLPFLLRTSPGYNLLVRGPANMPKRGIHPLEGIVESDWAVATFTMNWQIVEPHFSVTFEAGEPIAMLVPQRRGELERFRPVIKDIEADEDTRAQFHAWYRSRSQFIEHRAIEGSAASHAGFEKHYVRGTSPAGASADDHQVRLRLKPFEDER